MALAKIAKAAQGVEHLRQLETLSTRGREPAGPQLSLDSLSPREREIVESLLDAGSVTGVASSLHISLHTVRNHLKSIFRKLGVHSQVELVTQLRRD